VTKYRDDHILRLRRELSTRAERLVGSLSGPPLAFRGSSVVEINPVDVRIAVDDFKVILSEIRRLK
jgi:hypothetical protein